MKSQHIYQFQTIFVQRLSLLPSKNNRFLGRVAFRWRRTIIQQKIIKLLNLHAHDKLRLVKLHWRRMVQLSPFHFLNIALTNDSWIIIISSNITYFIIHHHHFIENWINKKVYNISESWGSLIETYLQQVLYSSVIGHSMGRLPSEMNLLSDHKMKNSRYSNMKILTLPGTFCIHMFQCFLGIKKCWKVILNS